jgi:hypothetical protein
MKFGLAFTYLFKDPDWVKKTLLTCVIGLIPVVGSLYLTGWMLTIARRVASGEELPALPEVNFGAYLKYGFFGMVVNLVYALPLIIITTPLSALAGSMQSDDTLSVVFIIASFCLGLLIFLYSLVLSLVSPAALTNMMVNDRLGAAFRLKDIFKLIKTAPGAYLLCLVGALIMGLITPIGLIACGIGILVTMVYSYSFLGHLFGQAYRSAKETLKLASPEVE